MSHCLIIQTKEKPRRTFGIVKERIVTSQPCSVIEDVQQGGHCGGGLNLCVFAKPKVCYQDRCPCHMRHVPIVPKSAGFPEGQRKLNEGQ